MFVTLTHIRQRLLPSLSTWVLRPYSTTLSSTRTSNDRQAVGGPAVKDDGREETRWQRLKRLRREWRKKGPSNHRPTPTFDRKESYNLDAAIQHVRSCAWAKFDESVELILQLNVDPRRAEHNMRGNISVPHGTGRADRIAVFVAEEDSPEAQAAKAAGACLVGGESLITQLQADRGKSVKGFAACLSVPEVTSDLAQKLGRILGSKGLLPNPNRGTVISRDLDKVVSDFARGRVYYRIDKFATLHMIVGKLSFTDEMLRDNISSVVHHIWNLKPVTVRKRFIKKAFLCSSMGPSVIVNYQDILKRLEA